MSELTPQAVMKIKKQLTTEPDKTYQDIADEFGVSKTTIVHIATGQTWGGVAIDGFRARTRKTNSRFSDAQVRQIRALSGSRNINELAELFEADRHTISNIINRKTYKHVR